MCGRGCRPEGSDGKSIGGSCCAIPLWQSINEQARHSSQGSSLGSREKRGKIAISFAHQTASAIVKVNEPVIIGRRIHPAKRRAAGARIAANIRRLQKSKTKRTAKQALAEARGERLAR